ncbi:unnamed protein product [Trifolium pratense]|uniref:Uncharacterized protein n=1 Tax=Trifolium pratense TaxID=57577 RepID=A0ACB0LQG8_TRIPR|nr:unnamed protein product [Trifolium pratense]
MSAIEVAHRMKWHNIWIEIDSALVVLAFQNNRWNNSLFLFGQLNGIVTHIYIEGNQIADSLANHGCALSSFTFWHQASVFI